MLNFLLLTPILGAAMLLCFDTSTNSKESDSESESVGSWESNSESESKSESKIISGAAMLKKEITIKKIALTSTLITFIISIYIYCEFDSITSEYQFTQEFNQVNFCHFYLGVDGISLYFIILTTFITPICILSNWNNIKKDIKYYLICFLVLETLLIITFVVLDIILFYIFFESVLIPLFLIVGIWGGSATRVRASFLLFLYTLFGSLFILLSFLVIYYNVGTTDFNIISINEISLDQQKILFIGIFISIAVKTPLIPFNTWLTYAHSEAPVGGSIILAGVILKLSLYGFLRIILQFLPDASIYFSPLVQSIAVISIIYASLSTIRQTDFKKIVAYSSVAHIGVVVLGIFSNTVQGISGAIVLGIAHGFVSPALFFICGGVLYDRYHTRTIRYYRGITNYIPIFSIFFFLFTIFNAAVPLSLNWVGEFIALTGIFQINPIIAFLASTGIVFSASYSIWLYNRICYATFSQFILYTTDINRREVIVLIPLLIITVLLGIYPNIILDQIQVSVTNLIYT